MREMKTRKIKIREKLYFGLGLNLVVTRIEVN